jgi:hypothetical protein
MFHLVREFENAINPLVVIHGKIIPMGKVNDDNAIICDYMFEDVAVFCAALQMQWLE